MCFSAEASFGVSAVLFPAGVYCGWNAWEKNRALIGLAVIPVIFGLQQLCEGLVWRGLENGNLFLARTAAFVFLYFALAFWPFWIPLCAFLTSSDPRKSRLLAIFVLLGFMGGLALYLPVLTQPEILVLRVQHHSIVYDFKQSIMFEFMPFTWWQALYVLIVGIPMLIAPSRGFTLLGIALIASAAVTHVFYWYAFTSVWCFFASLLSLYLCISFFRLQKAGPLVPRPRLA